MPLRGAGGTGDTISGRRCPLCGSPLAIWHNLTARPDIQPRSYIPRFAAEHDAIDGAGPILKLNNPAIKTRFHYTVAMEKSRNWKSSLADFSLSLTLKAKLEVQPSLPNARFDRCLQVTLQTDELRL